ncbi:myoferlin-like isoform X7 [Bolinopsis microptera]|uniref:myoferlin-like isoform X7 n=1 Tax=Bolinopsis microptera TaxID=2820187 RepID=UPI003078F120
MGKKSGAAGAPVDFKGQEGCLIIQVKTAAKLPNRDLLGESDPFVDLELDGIKRTTRVIHSELNPEWNETFTWKRYRPLTEESMLLIKVYDYEKILKNKLLGEAVYPLKDLVRLGAQEATVPLRDRDGKVGESRLNLYLEYTKPTLDPDEEMEEGTVADEAGNPIPDETEQEIEVAPGETPGAAKKKKSVIAAPRSSIDRSKLSTKKQDFQVRVNIHEGRKLLGGNIHPVCNIHVGKQSKHTRVQKSTNKPLWDEVLFFDFNCSALDLCDEPVTIEVLNSRKIRSDSLIGAFKFDLGLVYESADHQFVHKWVLLTDPEDKESGAKGYVKISISILGPGDKLKIPPKSSSSDDLVDIESNLLRPAGVQLQPATYTVKIYKAEDVPKMDTDYFEGMKRVLRMQHGDHDLVDPYMIVSFAGKKLKTKVLYKTYTPEWAQELNIGVQMPSMCEQLMLRLMDKDHFNRDDIIATHFLQLTRLSSADPDDEGFLPTFGPAYVNFYGSPRESIVDDELEPLNRGCGEGCSFRGRALVELTVNIGQEPSKDEMLRDIDGEDWLRVQPFQRRRRYRLFVGFLEGTMIHPVDAPVEFEISIGEYGNKFASTTLPAPSTTQPTNPVYDGSHYYYLPWGQTKPCVMLNSQWEDVMFRIESLNLICRTIDRLEGHLKDVKYLMRAKAPLAESAGKLIKLLDELIIDLNQPLLELPQKNITELDKKLYALRDDEMKRILIEAVNLRENARDIEQAIIEIDSYIYRLQQIATEPQNSIPDVIIWMLCGNRRVAYHRIPSHQVMFSPKQDCCGKLCGHVFSVFLKRPSVPDKSNAKRQWKLPAKLQVFVWMGLEDHAKGIQHKPLDGEISVFAETYENMISLLSKWTTRAMPRPKWSDITGQLKLPKESFTTPGGWRWAGEWFINPNLSLSYDLDSGLSSFQDDVFENQLRVPGSDWPTSKLFWTDVTGEEAQSKEDIMCPAGWEWTDIWTVDLNRAVDEEGYEYCLDQSVGGFVPVEKTYHLCRRRRWVRTRKRNPDLRQQAAHQRMVRAAEEGWEYSRLFTTKFHLKQRTMDMVRRRRWHRKMVADNPDADAIFIIDPTSDVHETKEEKEGSRKDSTGAEKPFLPKVQAPRMFITFKEPHTYQLRAYIYQARDLFSADPSGLSDPYARVVFSRQSQRTKILNETLCPTWDQTLVFEEVEFYGNPTMLAESPPIVVVELFDYDTVGSDFLGRAIATPIVKLGGEHQMAKLNWHPITRGGEPAGELLGAFELYLNEGAELPFMPPTRGDVYQVPSGIRPVMQLTRIEVLTWGVRHMKKFQLAAVNSPSIEIECGGVVLSTIKIKNAKKNPNFDTSSMLFDVFLPVEELYTPPLNIRLLDHRSFGVKPLVGTHMIKSLQEYRRDPVAMVQTIREKMLESGFGDAEYAIDMDFADPAATAEHQPPATSTSSEEGEFKEDVDWWSKYYSSSGNEQLGRVYREKGYENMVVFEEELENYFDNFTDLAQSFPLFHGKRHEDEDLDEDKAVGYFKGTFRVYPLPADGSDPPPRMLKNVPCNQLVEVLVRVYIVKAFELQPQDPNGLSDPYLALKLGRFKVKDRENYVPKNLSPTFGKMFELDGTLPLESELRVQIFDYDLLSGDDLIGETKIDLENRFLSARRGVCGLPKRYYVAGPYKWRDAELPRQILEKWCATQALPPPVWRGNSQVYVNGKTCCLRDYETRGQVHKDWGPPEERLALYTLLDLGLVPEHIETRTLYNPLRPEIPQGKIQIFVDIFPKSATIPPPINITPRAPQDLQLRVIVYNVQDVLLSDTSFTGEKMSDIYVKGWLKGQDKKQKTDVHYRSLNGEGNFNWRYVFPFKYLPAEEVMVIKKKEHFFSLDKHEEKHPVTFVCQIWDNDIFTPDDFLGLLELNLNFMPKANKFAKSVSLDDLPDNEKGKPVPMVSLFDQKNVKGWWPLYEEGGPDTPRELTGKVEMELEILSKEDSEAKPAGKGQEEPNENPHLDPPNRPATSFLWFTSPWKSLRYIIWNSYKWYILIGFIILLVVAMVGLFIYSAPGALSQKLIAKL